MDSWISSKDSFVVVASPSTVKDRMSPNLEQGREHEHGEAIIPSHNCYSELLLHKYDARKITEPERVEILILRVSAPLLCWQTRREKACFVLLSKC